MLKINKTPMEKLTSEELQGFKDINIKYQQFIFDLGILEVNIHEIKNQLDELNAERTNLLSDIKSIITKQQELSNKLGEKYGDKQVDLETGELK
jgi:DNA-binding transcriptional MerR regulator